MNTENTKDTEQSKEVFTAKTRPTGPKSAQDRSPSVVYSGAPKDMDDVQDGHVPQISSGWPEQSKTAEIIKSKSPPPPGEGQGEGVIAFNSSREAT